AAGITRFWAQPEFRDVISVTIIWGAYNVYLALVSIGALWEKRQVRQHHRLSVGGTAMVQFPRVNQRVPVDLVNLSVTGMSFSASLDFAVKDRERVLIEASGAEGLVNHFEGEVRRARAESGKTFCAVQFLAPEASYADLVRFVYGDSRRWVQVWDIRSRGIPLLDLMWQLGRMGLRGSWLCGAIVAKAAWRYAKRAFAWMRKAAGAAVAAAVALGSQAATMNLPFEQLTSMNKLELRCISDQREIQVPVPDRWRVKRAIVHLRYTVSANLIPDSSTLVVKLRGEPIAQARLNPQAPEVKLGVELPVALLEPGYNPIVFAASQHATKDQCESPCTPDLWTSINLRESYVEIEYDLKPLPRELSALSTHVFDPRLMPAGEVHIVIPDLSAASATLAGIVASGVARRFDYRRVSFTVSRTLRPGLDNVVVGRRSLLQAVPGTKGANLGSAIKGGYLKILPMVAADGSADAAHALLLLSGEDDAATKLAAITFSNISFRFPGSDELNAFEFALPQVSQYSGRETIASDTVYALKTLNFPTQSWVGLNPGERSITFRLPPDFHIRPNQHAKLLMNFSYGVGLKNDSSFNVSVNGRGVRAVRLDSATGTFIENYELNIPTYVFQPGSNVISFAAHLNSGGQVCDLLQPDGLFFTLYENSSLSFPPMPHFVEMPKLELFMHSGFPITRWPDGHEAYVWLADKDERTLAAALNLVGLATQRNGFPLFGLTFTHDRPAEAGEILVVGAAPAIDRELRAAAPLKLLEDGVTVPYPVVRGWNTETTSASSRQQSALGSGRGLFMQFQSPYQAGRSVVMLTASTPEDLVAASRLLLTSQVQSQAKGDLVLIEAGEKEAKVTAIVAGARYATGKKGTYSAVDSFLYTRPVVYYSVIALSLLAFAAALYFALRRWRAKRKGK
ncbi:MAG: cellulose biosynthesis cyclic di-GMP-binding regulatory protein BcsB, partial [Burkholderiales bacterium]|nr:cellulose biosynthesis cyclic di-GMP-binding regulatory protein BcsB [Burkholderiales bacterium]